MASNRLKQSKRERIKELVAAVLAEEARVEGAADRLETMDEIEEGMIRISNWVAREFGEQKLARHNAPPPTPPRCPACGHEGEVAGEEEREVLTRRGPVTLREAQCRCPKCRRHFFPSVERVGDGVAVRLLAGDVSADRLRGDAREQF